MQEIEQTLDSREVAAMVEKDHHKLMRDIRTYIVQLTESKIGFSDFFEESEYKDCTGRTLPCYRITKKGCEFIAHKLTGTKGTIFTARYINRFHEMESILSSPLATVAPVQPNQMQELAKEYAELRKEVDNLKADMKLTNRRCISVAYGSSSTYKGMALDMLQRLDDKEDALYIFRIYTLLKKHMERKTEQIHLTQDIR